nr:1,4-beta-D-xylan xylanohydrolase, endo 1,4-beta-xylanase {peptide 4} {EC 3.2.1.8} [Penicillium chrysogenum, Q 176, Peptide Partial, 14 aa] [Penicillium chrysogenum]
AVAIGVPIDGIGSQ